MQLRSLLVTLVRHGESQDNAHSVWAGFRDTPLTNTGTSQAMALGQAFANVPLTAIYCSDLKRAAMTAEEILQANRSIPPPPLVQSKSLRELNFGQAEGKSWAAAEWTAHAHGEDARSFRFQDGESLEDVNSRMAKAVRQFVLPRVEALRKQGASPAEVPHICIVAHGLAIAELLRVFMSLHDQQGGGPWADPRQTYKRVRLENTGWSRLELSVPVGNASSGRVSPQVPSSLATPQSLNVTADGQEATSAGSGDSHTLEGATADAARAAPPVSPEVGSASKPPTFVRILCQNQVEHLRAFAIPSTNIAGGTAHALGGGGLSSNTGAVPHATSPSPGGSNGNGPTGSDSVTKMPSSGTLASIASNATLSTSASNATFPAPSTPAAGGPGQQSRSVQATPASARSLNAYDVKIMARELERAGAASMLAGTESHGSSGAASSAGGLSQAGSGPGLPSGTATPVPSSVERPGLPPSSSSLSALNSGPGSSGAALPAGSPNASIPSFLHSTGATSDVWQSICVRVLPLFNGEGLRTSIEDLNDLVSQHVRRTLDRGPARALDALSTDLSSLAASGTLTLNSKLIGLDDVRLLVRLAELWTFFLGQVLPYIQGCFLPFQTDPVLQSLTTNLRSTHGGPSQSIALSPNIGSALRTEKINVRRVLLSVFRDQVVLPQYERLSFLFSHINEVDPAFCSSDDSIAGEGSKQVYLRLLQMTSILASVVSDDDAQAAVDGLVRALRVGSKAAMKGKDGVATSEFGLGVRTSSPIQQRSNRRGWMAQKARKHGLGSMSDSFSLGSIAGGGSVATASHGVRSVPVTTINRFGQGIIDYLATLRSPTASPDPSDAGQPRPPTPPSKDAAHGTATSPLPRRSEDSARTAAPRTHAAPSKDGAVEPERHQLPGDVGVASALPDRRAWTGEDRTNLHHGPPEDVDHRPNGQS